MSNSGVAAFPWDAPAEPIDAPIGLVPFAMNSTTAAGFRTTQLHGQDIATEAGDISGASDNLRGIMRSGGVDDSHIGGPGGLVLPGGGQIAQSDGASSFSDTESKSNMLNLSPRQIDEIIANNIKRGRIPSNNDDLRSGLEIELTIPPHILHKLQLQQTDGGIEDNDGSDGINSDLDDSDEDHDLYEEDEDLETGMIMLCLYDKVQRVKNKWKYVLKDGIANINGKDYVFAKATGESEW